MLNKDFLIRKFNSLFNFSRNILTHVYKKGFFHLLSANYLAAFLAFITQMLIAWWLTPADIGRIKVLQSILGIMVVFSGLCFNISILKLCSENRPEGERKYLFMRACMYVFPIIIIAYLSIILASGFHLLSKDDLINHYAPLYMLALLPSIYYDFFVSYLQSIKEFKLIALIRIISKFFAVFLIIALTYFFHLKGYLIGFVCGWIIITVLFFYSLRKHLKQKIIPVLNVFKKHWQYAKYVILTRGIGQLSLVLDILILNFFINDRILIGYYSFAAIFVTGFNVVISTQGQIALPYLSNKSDNIDEVKSSVKKYSRPLYLVSAVCLFLGLILVPFFLHYVFSGKYDRSVPFFYILFIAWFFRSTQSLRLAAIQGLGAFNLSFYIGCVGFLLNLVFTLLLVKMLNVNGVALGQLLSSFLSIFIISYVYNKLMKSYFTILQN